MAAHQSSHRGRSIELVVVNQVGAHGTVENSIGKQSKLVTGSLDSLRPDRVNRSFSGTHMFTSARERRRAVKRDLAGQAMQEGTFWPED